MKRALHWSKRLMPLFFFIALLLSACEGEAQAPTAETIKVIELPLGDKFSPVPGSTFLMGSQEGDALARPDEIPQREVILPTFFIMKHEVSNQEYRQCVQAGACTEPLVEESGPTSLYPDPAYNAWPVVGVDWFQAQAYCQFIDARLPSEAEWEKAARGREGFTFPWGEDEPSCDLLNMAGCLEQTDTEHVVAFRDTKSVYDTFDLAGNVREWTADWYSPDYYQTADNFAPTGPEEGAKKVVRGGSFEDGVEEVRTAARLAMDPKEQSPLVGFRCVPVVKTVAAMCQPSYRNFCDPGTWDDGDEPCEPGGQDECGEYALAGFGCPLNDQVSVNINVPAGTDAAYNVTVGADGFTCVAGGDGFITCTGPEQEMGTDVTITVCGPPPSGTQQAVQSTTASLPADYLLAAFETPLLSQTTPQTPYNTGFCPYGYHFDQAEEACVMDEEVQPCPEGWRPETKFDEELQQEVLECVLEDTTACPEGTAYDELAQGCVLVVVEGVDSRCPDGYELTDETLCQPPVVPLAPCLPGYWFATRLNCCLPLDPSCEEESYFDTLAGGCLPQNPGGCPECMLYDTLLGCVAIPECTPGQQDDANDVGQTTPVDCYNDNVTPSGECPPKLTEGECPENYIYAPDPVSGEYTCVPYSGPGSDCPEGYALDPRTFCCVPLGENPCPDGETPDGDGTTDGNNPTNAGTPNDQGLHAYQLDGLNPYSGDCGEQGTDTGCPPGTTADENGYCVDDDSGGVAPQCPEHCWPGTTDPYNCYCDPTYGDTCPANDPCWQYLPDQQVCTYTCGGNQQDGAAYNPCDSEDMVYIPELGLCVPLGDDCCAPGYDWSAYFGSCMPILQNFTQTPTSEDCNDGYMWVNGQCLLISRRNPEQCCWSITVNVPQCVGGCEVGFTMVNGQCVQNVPDQPEQPTDPCPQPIQCPTSPPCGTCCVPDQSGGKCIPIR